MKNCPWVDLLPVVSSLCNKTEPDLAQNCCNQWRYLMNHETNGVSSVLDRPMRGTESEITKQLAEKVLAQQPRNCIEIS